MSTEGRKRRRRRKRKRKGDDREERDVVLILAHIDKLRLKLAGQEGSRAP